MAGSLLILVAHRSLKHPIAVLEAGFHPVKGLLRVLLTLVLRYAGQQVLHQNTVGIIAKLNGGRFQRCPRLGDSASELEVSIKPTSQPGNIVNNGHTRVFAVLAQMLEHILHTRALDQATGDIIGKYRFDLIALVFSVFAAARLLRAEPIAPRGLGFIGYPAVNDCLCYVTRHL
nr:hypothetical protein [Halioxenophilus sp. WMMB6]